MTLAVVNPAFKLLQLMMMYIIKRAYLVDTLYIYDLTDRDVEGHIPAGTKLGLYHRRLLLLSGRNIQQKLFRVKSAG